MSAAEGPGCNAGDHNSHRRKEALQQLCNANGIREEDVKHPERVTSIEMVLDDYCCMQSLKYFSNLKSVCLIQQAISKIEGLDECVGLERLLLNENRIEQVEGLGGCVNLKQLHLCTNAIQELGTGLQGLARLEVFWVAENMLTSLKGIEMSPNIVELNAARNQLASLEGSFERSTRLSTLNVSDNRICSFRDVLYLSRMPGLKDVAFSDPDWGENPICLLCNYQTYCLYHLPSVRFLDRMHVSDSEHQAAEAAFARKRLYYNMRIKLAKRQAADSIRFARSLHDECTNTVRGELEATARVLRGFDGWAKAQESNPPDTLVAAAQPKEEEAKRPQVERQLQATKAELADAAVSLQALCAGVRKEEAVIIRGLRTELQSGGNLRMEPSPPTREPWAKQIQDLVSARFKAEDFTRFGIMDIKVQQVTRVHNRSLRIRFEELIDRLELDGSTQQIEYLFYIPDPKNTTQHLRAVAEEGPGGSLRLGEHEEAQTSSSDLACGGDSCNGAAVSRLASNGANSSCQTPSSSTSAAIGLAPDFGPLSGPGAGQGSVDKDETVAESACTAALLTNSVFVAEAARLELFGQAAQGQAVARAMRRGVMRQRRQFSGSDVLGLRDSIGMAIGGGGSSSSSTPAAGSMPREDGLPGPAVCSGSLLLCSACLGEQHQDQPMSFDPIKDGGLQAYWAREPSQLDPQVTQPHATKGGPAGLNFHSCYRGRAGEPKQKVWHVPHTDLVLPEYLIEFDYIYSSEFVQTHIEERKCEYGPFGALVRDFSFAARVSGIEKIATTTADDEGQDDGGSKNSGLAESATGAPATDMPALEYLDSASCLDAGNNILGACDAGMLAAIKVLNLHGRGIRRIEAEALQPLRSLQVLLLSFNVIASFNNLPICPTVTHLDVSFNLLEKVTSLKAMPSLEQLDLSWNSLGLTLEVCDMDAALRDVIRSLARDVPGLQVLDLTGNPMTRSSWYRAVALAGLPRLEMLDEQEVTDVETKQAMQRVARVENLELTEPLLLERAYASVGAAAHLSLADAGGDERSRMSTLLSGFGADRSLNAVSRPVGLNRQTWRKYTNSLDLRDLGCTELCSLTSFSQLRRLYLCGNRLTSLRPLSACSVLEELSVERNLLDSLAGAGDLPELRRLDAGSNRLNNVLELRKLTKLIQLSLEDNLVDSLDTFAGLMSLVELYLSSNLIEEMRSVLLLKQLPKLLVLDLSGNELCSSQDYRLYTMFHLRKLKILDGGPVTPAEQQQAEERFSGKITMELLEDKLGPLPSCYNFRSVDLSNQNLRELGQFLNDDIFPSLRELSLNGNPFTDLKTVGPLSKLLVLKINRTKVDLEKGMMAEGDAVGGIGSMPHLQVLELGNSGIADMSFFSHFPLQSLRILHLPGNDLTRIDGLSHMEQLRELVLDKNKVKQIDENAFEGLRSLRELRMDDNGLKSLANLGPLPRLRALHLSVNRIAELSELERLRNLRHVVVINLAQNPVARKPLYRPHLINAVGSARAIDGREVTDEERERAEQLLQGGGTQPPPGSGVYVFNEQQNPVQAPSIPLAYVGPSLLSGIDSGQQKAAAVGVQSLGQDGRGRGEPSMRTAAPMQSHVVMTGLSLGDADGRRESVAGTAGRRASASHHVHAAAHHGGPDHGGGDGGGGAAPGGRRASNYGARSQSVPNRHVGVEYRPTIMPPGSGR